MLTRIKDTFDRGVEKVKWVSTILSDRLKIEFSIMKLLYQSEQMEKRKDELIRTIGKRIYEMKEHSDRHITKDRVIVEAIEEIEKISSEIDATRKKASEISSTV